MMKSAYAQLGELLVRRQDEERINPEKTYLTGGLFNNGRGMFKRSPRRGNQTKYQKYNRIHAYQVIYSKLFGWEGSIALVEPDFDGLYVSSEFPTFDIRSERATPEYFRYLVRWPGLHEMMAKCTTGLGQRRQRVQVEQLLSLSVPVPSIDEQHRIAARLDYLYKRRQEASEQAKQAARLLEALHNVLCQVNGPMARVGESISLVRNPVSIDATKVYRQIGIYSFGKGIIRRDPVLGVELSKLRYFEVPVGALVLSNIQAWEGAVAVSTEADSGFIASNRFLSYYPASADVDTNYLRYFFLSDSGQPLIRQASPGTMVRNRTLGIKAFENLKIPLPGIDEQRRIRNLLDRAYEVLRRIEARERLFDALVASALNQAFGQLG
jgi:type I restriction enzyme S subunit